MAYIFTNKPGIACVLQDPYALPITVVLGGWGDAVYRNAALQSVTISSSGNCQFANTLRNFVYVYVFGEKMGDITFTGATFVGECGIANVSGVSNVIGYYAARSVSQTGMPVAIRVGLAGFYGFLTNVEVKITNPETHTGQFVLQFKSIA